MRPDQIAIYISLAAVTIAFISVIIAAFSLGWNIHRDLLKPRLKVRFGQYNLFDFEDGIEGPLRLGIMVTNHGPGKIRIDGLWAKQTSWVKSIRKKETLYMLKPDFDDPYCGPIPCDLKVREPQQFYLRYHEKCILDRLISHVGISDSFGRYHWAKRKDVRRAKNQFFEDKKKGFGEEV